MSMREEFEAWWALSPFVSSIVPRHLAREIWEASRAALSVESCHTHPELILTNEDRAYEQGVQNQLSKVKAAGLQVKP